MKINVTDIVTVKTSGVTFKVKVEDASKGDIISGKIESVDGESSMQVGGVYDFPRSDIAP